MEVKKDLQITSSQQRPILLDTFYQPDQRKKPVIIFAHGFKGFKDWGTFNKIAEAFALNGFIFVKFNFSLNGTTPEKPTEFADLDAFSQNRFTQELDDLGKVIDWVTGSGELPENEIDRNAIYLTGHSRGGGIAILKAAGDNRISKIASWAAVNDFGQQWDAKTLKQWKNNGVLYIKNVRTGQDMPLKYQLVENYYENQKALDISRAIRSLQKPFLIIHGTNDESVNFHQALEMKKWNPGAQLELIPEAGHTFGGKHPYTENKFPQNTQTLIKHTTEFFKKKQR